MSLKGLHLMSNRHLTIQDMKSRAMRRHLKEPLCEKINHMEDLIELMSLKFSSNLRSSMEENNASSSAYIPVLNFWLIAAHEDDDGDIFYTSKFKSVSTSRKLTDKFVDNDRVADSELADYFYSVLSKPPQYLSFIKELMDILIDSPHLFPGTIKSGNHISYLINVLFSEILYATYNEDREVYIKGLGLFVKKSKRKGKGIGTEGHLQFQPDLS